MRPQKISVVIPIFNPTSNLSSYLSEIAESLGCERLEFILVCDGRKATEKFSKLGEIKIPHGSTVIPIHLRRNYGQHRATWHGISKSVGDVVLTVDEDAQHNPSDVSRVFEELVSQSLDLVVGSYTNSGRSILREMFGRTYHWFTDGNPNHENRTSLRAISKNYITEVLGTETQDDFLLGPLLWRQTDYRTTVPVTLATGNRPSTYSWHTLFRLGIGQIVVSDRKLIERLLGISVMLCGVAFSLVLAAVCLRATGINFFSSTLVRISWRVSYLSLLSSSLLLILVVLRKLHRDSKSIRVSSR